MANREFIQTVVRRSVWEKDSAADIMQSVLLKAFENWGQFDGRCRIQTWLYRIAVNECMEANRRTTRRRRRFVGSSDIPFSDPAAPDGLAAVTDSEIRKLIDEALGQAGERCRAAFELYYMHEYSGREAADKLNVTEAAFCMRLKTARDCVRALLIKRGFGHG